MNALDVVLNRLKKLVHCIYIIRNDIDTMNYLLSIKTENGFFYGGSIKAASVDDADEAAFIIYKKLKLDGFNNIIDIEAIDYFNFKNSLPIQTSKDLQYYSAYYRIDLDEDLTIDSIDRMIYYFETIEHYEKCAKLLKKKSKIIYENNYN